MGYIYLLQSPKCKRLYLGSTRNLIERQKEHNKGTTKATRSKGPWSIIWSFEFSTYKEALDVEFKIKRSKVRLSIESVEKFCKNS